MQAVEEGENVECKMENEEWEIGKIFIIQFFNFSFNLIGNPAGLLSPTLGAILSSAKKGQDQLS